MSAYGKKRRKGGSGGLFFPMHHATMDAPAWCALSLAARSRYLELRKAAGIDASRNGSVFLSVRDAADRLNCTRDYAAKAFHDLQRKGFIRAREIGRLGVEGEGRATQWLLTEIGTAADPKPEKAFLRWQPGHDFEVVKGRPPRHKNKTLSRPAGQSCPVSSDVLAEPVPCGGTPCPVSSDVGADFEPEPVPSRRTYKDIPACST
jgi:hypothetical protein